MRRRWRFDLDGTLVDSLTASHLRPHAVNLLAVLRSCGCEITVWSAGGVPYARGIVARLPVGAYVDDIVEKARGADGRWCPSGALDELAFVDDQPEGLPLGAEIHPVFPYVAPNQHDRALLELIRALPAPGRR
jgi:phosphoglycolate phosphatase-like HAD superfamily hydrolase